MIGASVSDQDAKARTASVDRLEQQVEGVVLHEVANDRFHVGASAEQAARAFDRFYRADDSRTRTTGAGAGLGPAVARSLVESHGGRLELDTAPGRGARFRIVLPATGLDR